MINTYASLHVHSEFSSAVLKFPDAINKVKDIVEWCYNNGLYGVALSDHQSVSGFVELEKAANDLPNDRPFKHIFADECYLISKEEEERRQNDEDFRIKYWHYLVIALDEIGLKQLYEISSRAWLRSYTYKGYLRRPNYFEDFEEIVGKDKGHIVVSSSCLGGFLPNCILNEDMHSAKKFIDWNIQTFGEGNFFLECQPCYEDNKEQLYVNKALWQIHEKFNIPIIVTTDAHYLRPEQKYIHTAFLKSKDGGDSREPDKFYATTYLFTPQELRDMLYISGFNDGQIDEMFQNTIDIADRVQVVALKKQTRIPSLPSLPDFNIKHTYAEYYDQFPFIKRYALSKDKDEQYYFYQVECGLNKYRAGHNINVKDYLEQINIEMEQVDGLSKIFGGRMSDYFTVVQKIVDLIWTEGDSLVGIGRGCFTGEAPVWTKRGLKRLDEVKIGDEVISADGKFNRVINTMNYHIKEPLIRIEYRTQGSSKKHMPSICTLDHKILTGLNGKIEYVEAQKLTKKHKVCLPKLKCKPSNGYNRKIDLSVYAEGCNYTEDWIEERTLTNKPYDYSPHDLGRKLSGSRSWYQKLADGRVTKENSRNKKLLQEFFANAPFKSLEEYRNYCSIHHTNKKVYKRYIDIDEDFCVLIGMLLGDGYINLKKNVVMLAINNEENNRKNLYNRKTFENFANKYGFEVNEYRSKNNKRLSQLFIYSGVLSRALGDWLFISKIHEQKQVNPWIVELPYNLLLCVKQGLLNSDGFYNDKDNKKGFDSTSCSLLGLYKIIDMYENTTVSSLDVRLPYTHNSQGYKCRQSYKLRAPIIDKYKGPNVITQNQDYWFLPIISLEVLPKTETTVYDLTIENNPSYTIGNMCVHNSAGCYLTNFLLGITGLDPMLPELKDFFPWWRFCSVARSQSIFDIDIDIQSFKKEQIIDAIKKHWGWRKVCQVVTWGKLTSKTSLERAGKGLGISDDTIGYIKSLIPVKRGATYSLNDCLFGNTKKEREKVPEFIAEVNKYPGLLETALAFEGMKISSGVHAGAVNLLHGDFTETGSYMVSSNGSIVSQFDLHDAEYSGDLKMDLLSIDALQTIRTAIELLIKDGYMKWQGTLRDTYNHYLRYDIIEKESKEMWDLLPTMLNAFQYDSRAGKEALNKIGAQSLTELTLANGLMRLAVPSGEQPMDKYVRYRKNIKEWYQDMTDYGIPQNEQEILKELLGKYCGMMISQETCMSVLMNDKVCNFTMKEADQARKAIAKKSAEALAETEERLYHKGAECGRSKKFLDYLWLEQIEMSKSYAFAFSHSAEYSTECLQELNIYWKYPKAYWNAAVVISQSQTEDKRENVSVAIDYGKISQSIYKARTNNIHVWNPSINRSESSFGVDKESLDIMFGLGAISGINSDIVNQIIANRPYASFHDFYSRNSYQGSLITQSKFIQLIKAGCFDEFEQSRLKVMKQYIVLSTNKKQSLTMANLPEALKIGAKPPKQLLAPYSFRKYVCSPEFFYGNHPNFKSKKLYWLDEKALNYFNNNLREEMKEEVDWWIDNETDKTIIVDKAIDKFYKAAFDNLKEYINTPEYIDLFNRHLYNARLNELVPNKDENHWAFEALSYYDREHELANLNKKDYMVTDFDKIPDEPEFITKTYGKRSWKQYRLFRLAGTCIAKDDSHHTVTLLDVNNNVVQVKMDRSYYAHMKRQISVPDGKGGKTVMDKSWFTRGTCLMVSGYRQDSTTFRVKNYKSSLFPKRIQKIESINKKTGEIVLIDNRYGFGEEDELN